MTARRAPAGGHERSHARARPGAHGYAAHGAKCLPSRRSGPHRREEQAISPAADRTRPSRHRREAGQAARGGGTDLPHRRPRRSGRQRRPRGGAAQGVSAGRARRRRATRADRAADCHARQGLSCRHACPRTRDQGPRRRPPRARAGARADRVAGQDSQEARMERATLLRMLRENRAFFDQTVALVSDERMREPPREGHWSGKDILAHVTTWERRLLGWLAAAARGASTQIAGPGATWDDMDRLNAVPYAATRDRTVEDITADSRRLFAQVLAQIEAFSDDDLSDPTRFPWLDRQPLWRRIAAGPGYGHYQAHLYDLWERIAPERRFAPAPTQLAACAGRYVDREGGTVTLVVEADHLVARRSWEP